MQKNTQQWALKKYLIERCMKELQLCCPIGNDEDECNTAFFEALNRYCMIKTRQICAADNEDNSMIDAFFEALIALDHYPFKKNVTNHVSKLTLTDKYVWISHKWILDCLDGKSYFGTGSGIMNNLKSALSCIKLERDYLKR